MNLRSMRILLVEDQARLAAHIASGLGEDGHAVTVVHDGAAALAALAGDFDVVLLDWALPERDGIDVLKTWRARGVTTPVLMLTARDTIEERVMALRSGADDHLGKPFAYDELLARIEALSRRRQGATLTRCGDIVVDRESHMMTGPSGALIQLTGREYGVLAELINHRDAICDRARLLETAWGGDLDVAPNAVDVYIGYVRSKLAQAGSRQVQISTVRGVGYRLMVTTAST